MQEMLREEDQAVERFPQAGRHCSCPVANQEPTSWRKRGNYHWLSLQSLMVEKMSCWNRQSRETRAAVCSRWKWTQPCESTGIHEEDWQLAAEFIETCKRERTTQDKVNRSAGPADTVPQNTQSGLWAFPPSQDSRRAREWHCLRSLEHLETDREIIAVCAQETMLLEGGPMNGAGSSVGH